MSLIALYYVCSVGIYYNVHRFKRWRHPRRIQVNIEVDRGLVTRNIVQLNSFYIKFEPHYFLYLYNKYHNILKNLTINICYSRRYNIVTQSCIYCYILLFFYFICAYNPIVLYTKNVFIY
jgi:hypothetical protein